MAIEPKTIILMPALDKAEGVAQLELSTSKSSSGGLASSAHVQFAQPDGGVSFLMCGDFRKYFPRSKVAATQKNLNTLHASTFTPSVVETLKAEVRAFYANKRNSYFTAKDTLMPRIKSDSTRTKAAQFVGLPVGTKVYYVGDAANQPRFGTITAITSDRWSACQYDMFMSDGQVVKGIQPSNFGGLERGGHRFRLQVEEDEPRRRSEEEYYAHEIATRIDEAGDAAGEVIQ